MTRFLLGFSSGFAAAALAGVGLLVGIGHALAVSDPLEPADAIVAISGDTGARVATAVELYEKGYGRFILFSGSSLDPRSVSSAEIMRRQAVALGAPAGAILVEPAASTTQQNAEYVARMMVERKLRTAILVTSPYHQRRAAMHFARAFEPHGLAFRNHPARDRAWDPAFWWTKDPARTLTLVEIVKLALETMEAGGEGRGVGASPP